jgi:RNA polymerase sigma-B factor
MSAKLVGRSQSVPTGGTGTALARGDEELFLAWQSRGEQRAREALVERYMPLVRRLARRYGRTSEPFEDLLQVGSLGLLHAIERYDVGHGRPFTAFAVPTILGEMRRYFRDAGWTLHVPRSAKERALAVRDAIESLRMENGRSPTAGQLAQFLELDVDEVLEALVTIEAYETCSLDAPRQNVDGPGASYTETLGDEDDRYELIECEVSLRTGLAQLTPRERRILRLRFVDDLTQSAIAERIGLSQMQVSRVLRQSLDRLRDLACAQLESG